MRLLLAAAFAATLAAPAFAQTPAAAPAAALPAGAYVMDRTHANLVWKGLHQGMSWYVARFTDFSIDLTFDPADVSKSKVSATVNMASIETDFLKTRPATSKTDFNEELSTGANFFNTGKFPKASFVSTAIKKTGDKTGTMTGNLTYLGVTKPITFDISFVGTRNDPRIQKQKVGFQAVGTLKKSEFGMSPGSIADDVKLEINAEFAQK